MFFYEMNTQQVKFEIIYTSTLHFITCRIVCFLPASETDRLYFAYKREIKEERKNIVPLSIKKEKSENMLFFCFQTKIEERKIIAPLSIEKRKLKICIHFRVLFLFNSFGTRTVITYNIL